MGVRIYQSTRSPSLSDTIKVNGVAFDLTDCTVKFRMRAIGSSTLTVDADATVVSASDGTVRYDWGANDLATAGDYLAWWRVTLSSGLIQETEEFVIEVLAHDGGARATMDDLVMRVRGLAGAGTAAFDVDSEDYFTDEHIQDALDRNRIDVWRELLTSREDLVGGGTVQWLEYASAYDHFEKTASGGSAVFVVEDGLGSVIGTASWTADYQRGLVTFGSDTSGTAYYLTGRSYDVYAAAAEIVEQRAAGAAASFDFSTDNMSVRRGQKATALRMLASDLRRRSRPKRARLRRSDERTRT